MATRKQNLQDGVLEGVNVAEAKNLMVPVVNGFQY